jgi:hypothetical protein
MAKIFPGRYAAQSDEPFVVFLIGMFEHARSRIEKR